MATDYTQAPASYTPTTSPTPSFGQSGSSVTSLQQSLNSKGANLKVDGLYGPKTYAAANPNTSNLVATSGAARTQFSNDSAALTNALGLFNSGTTNPTTTGSTTDTAGTLNPSDPFVSSLNAVGASSDAATKALISSIQAERQNQINTATSQEANYKSGLQLMGVQSNEAQSTPDLLSAHISAADSDLQSKISTINSEYAKTLAQAQQAQATQENTTLKEKMAYATSLQKAKTDALTNYYDTITKQTTVASDTAQNIYATLQTLDPSDQHTFLQKIAQTYNIPFGNLVSAVSNESVKQKQAALKTDNAQATLDKKSAGGTASTKGATYNSTKAGGALGSGGTLNGVTYNGRGSDGFVDPDLYVALYTNYANTYGQTAANKFVKDYPIASNINPDSAAKVSAVVKPTTKTAGSSRSL